jgi:hypothetical protein
MRAKGLRVFVVEDAAMIRMMVVDMLEELSHSVSAETGRLDQAMQLAQSTDFDLAILDVNLDGKIVTPVALLIEGPRSPNHFYDRLWRGRLARGIQGSSCSAKTIRF